MTTQQGCEALPVVLGQERAAVSCAGGIGSSAWTWESVFVPGYEGSYLRPPFWSFFFFFVCLFLFFLFFLLDDNLVWTGHGSFLGYNPVPAPAVQGLDIGLRLDWVFSLFP